MKSSKTKGKGVGTMSKTRRPREKSRPSADKAKPILRNFDVIRDSANQTEEAGEEFVDGIPIELASFHAPPGLGGDGFVH